MVLTAVESLLVRFVVAALFGTIVKSVGYSSSRLIRPAGFACSCADGRGICSGRLRWPLFDLCGDSGDIFS